MLEGSEGISHSKDAADRIPDPDEKGFHTVPGNDDDIVLVEVGVFVLSLLNCIDIDREYNQELLHWYIRQ